MRYLLLAAVVSLGACTTNADVAYSPAVAPMPAGPQAIHAVSATDGRKDETDPTYVGAIRGGFGNPLKTLKTNRPVADEVRAAFEQALVARGLFGPAGRDTLSVDVVAFSANQMIGPYSRAAFTVQLRDADGHVVYQDMSDVGGYAFQFLTNGVFGSVEGLRAFVEQKMTEAIDQVLDKPAFVAALHGSPDRGS